MCRCCCKCKIQIWQPSSVNGTRHHRFLAVHCRDMTILWIVATKATKGPDFHIQRRWESHLFRSSDSIEYHGAVSQPAYFVWGDQKSVLCWERRDDQTSHIISLAGGRLAPKPPNYLQEVQYLAVTCVLLLPRLSRMGVHKECPISSMI